ncbi:MAG TPA: DUF6471 domain-containing protein [Caulobacteraceae bacterium]
MKEADASLVNPGLEQEWQKMAKKVIRVAMAHLDFSYADLVVALAALGVFENERALRNKVARGTFSAAFFLQVLWAMNIETLDLSAFTAPHEEGLMGRLEVKPLFRAPRGGK